VRCKIRPPQRATRAAQFVRRLETRVQIGLLDPAGLPVVGADAARKVVDPKLPSNELIAGNRRS
jgi:hypothetical protein